VRVEKISQWKAWFNSENLVWTFQALNNHNLATSNKTKIECGEKSFRKPPKNVQIWQSKTKWHESPTTRLNIFFKGPKPMILKAPSNSNLSYPNLKQEINWNLNIFITFPIKYSFNDFKFWKLLISGRNTYLLFVCLCCGLNYTPIYNPSMHHMQVCEVVWCEYRVIAPIAGELHLVLH
jgi:hypothetical protein